MSNQSEGGCLCGAVRFVATGEPISVAWCHCQSCRKHSGAPVSVFVAFERSAYTVTKGEITKFNSSPRTRRGFCARCGSTLTCESESRRVESIAGAGPWSKVRRLNDSTTRASRDAPRAGPAPDGPWSYKSNAWYPAGGRLSDPFRSFGKAIERL